MKLNRPAGPQAEGSAGQYESSPECGDPAATPSRGISSFRQWLLAAVLMLAGIAVRAQAPAVQPAELQTDEASQGRQLAEKIRNQTPAENSTVQGHLLIRGTGATRASIPVTCVILADGSNWQSIYQADFTNRAEVLWIEHGGGRANRYFQATLPAALSPQQLAATQARTDGRSPLSSDALMTPFAGSDFCVADLGLEFFHWPGQKVLKLDIHRSRGCTVLESTTPSLTPTGYARVVSWIDNETLGIVEAYAYDAQGQKLKDFYPKDFKKVNGRWQVETLVMEDALTGSRSRLEFELKK